jgi:hypothetical protein
VPSKNSVLHHIRRVDYPAKHTHGWLVQVQRQGKRHMQFFNDNTHGGPGEALDVALAHRDELLAFNAPMTRQAYVSIRRRNNTSGVPGVSRGYRIRNQGGKTLREWFWAAYWAPEPGKRKSVSFLERAYGKKGAFRRAVRLSARKLYCKYGATQHETRLALCPREQGAGTRWTLVVPEARARHCDLTRQPA